MPFHAMRIEDDAAKADHSVGDPGPGREMPAWRFRLAVFRHDRAVYRLARCLLRDDREAEDITQEVFLKLWQQGADIEQPKHWLLRVARNACLDRLRRSRRVVSQDDTTVPELTETHDPSWHYQQQELTTRLRSLVATLPEPQRSLIELFDHQGMSGTECASILGLNLTQVKVYLHRARKRLRLQLEQSE